MMEIKINKKTERMAIMAISGRITAATAPEIKEQIKKLVSEGWVELILDLSETTFIDSSGLSAFVSGLKQTKENNGKFRLAALNNDVYSIFKITMLDKIFELYPTVDLAIN